MEDATPSDALRGRREDIPPWRSERQLQTIDRRRRHNRALKEPTRSESGPWSLKMSQICWLPTAGRLSGGSALLPS